MSRIDHGMNSIQDPWLVREIKRRNVALTVCPLAYLSDHSGMHESNIRTMLDNKIPVTVNSDDPAYMNGYIGDVYLAIQQALSLNAEEIYKLSRNAFEAAFLPESEINTFLDELDRVMERWRGGGGESEKE